MNVTYRQRSCSFASLAAQEFGSTAGGVRVAFSLRLFGSEEEHCPNWGEADKYTIRDYNDNSHFPILLELFQKAFS